MILIIVITQMVASLGQMNIVDSTSILSQYGDGTRVLSGSSRDLLKQFQLDLDDLSARMGATTFGRAESIDQNLFRELRYVSRTLSFSFHRCCEPEISFDASQVPTTTSTTTTTVQPSTTVVSATVSQTR